MDMEHDWKREKTRRHQFENREELKAIIMGLPDAEYRTVHLGDEVEREEISEGNYVAEGINWGAEDNHLAIVNKRTEDIAAIVSDQYDKQNHSDVFHPIIDALADLGLNVHGEVVEFDKANGVQIEARFNGEEFHVDGDPEDSKMFRGFIARNSYDADSSVTFKGFAERFSCSNGMLIERGMGVEPLKRKHFGNVDIEEEYREWFEELIEKSEEFKELLEQAAQDRLGVVNQVLKNVGVPKTKIDPIAAKLEVDEDDATRFDIYNAITNYITHDLRSNVTIGTEDKYHKYGKKVLKDSEEALLKVED